MIDRASQLTREYDDADQMYFQGALPTENAPAATGNAVIGALPAELSPAMVAGTPSALSSIPGSAPAEVAPGMAGPETGISKLVEQSIPAEVVPAMTPAPAMAAPIARQYDRNNPSGLDEMGFPLPNGGSKYSPTQGYGMVPVYQSQGRVSERKDEFGNPLEPVLLGYEFNPIAAGLTTVDVPKPAAVLAEEKRIGKPMEATYATFTEPMSGGDRGQRESIAYGPPTGYRYDNGQSQYVKFDAGGNYYETEQRKGEFDDALKMAALFAAIYTGGASLGLGETAALGAGQVAAAGATFTPEMIAAGLAPGAAGATGAASGALAGANLAAAGGLSSLGTGAAALGGSGSLFEAAASPLASGYSPSISALTNEAVASGMAPGSLGASMSAAGTLSPEALAAAAGVTTAGATPALVELARAGKGLPSVNEMVASGMSPGSAGAAGAAAGQLTPAELAAASGVVTKGSVLSDAADLLSKKVGTSGTSGTSNTSNTYISGGTTGGSSSGPWNSYLTPQVSRIGAIQPIAMANPLAGLISPIATSRTPSSSMLDRLNKNNFAKGGEVVKADLSKFEPEFVDLIKKRSGGSPDHHHPNYNGNPLFRTGGAGRHVQGPGTGQSDDIPAMLADGEYVFDADTVSALGDGSNKAGASALDQMRKAIRKHKRGAPIDKIPPKAKNPLEYLRGK
jgi:hypothetical protein